MIFYIFLISMSINMELSQPCLMTALRLPDPAITGLQAMEDCWPWPTKPPPPTRTQQLHPRRPGRNRRHPCEAAMRCGVACGSGKGDGPPISGICSKGKPHENFRIWKPFHPRQTHVLLWIKWWFPMVNSHNKHGLVLLRHWFRGFGRPCWPWTWQHIACLDDARRHDLRPKMSTKPGVCGTMWYL
jgi:hypothetical protein